MLIQKKKNICSCGSVSYGFKKCIRCRSVKYSERSAEKLQKPIKRINSKKERDIELNDFFNRHIRIIAEHKKRCQECGIPIPNPSRWNVAHILPKAIFKSVSSNDENIMYLCRTNGCHARFDSNWEAASKMNVWAFALMKVKTILPLVKEKHKILNQFT